MEDQKVVTVENGRVTSVWDGTFETGSSNETILKDLIERRGFDVRDHIRNMERIIIGMYRRHPEDEQFLKEVLGESMFRGWNKFYQNSKIKTRTEKEKAELIEKIRNDEY